MFLEEGRRRDQTRPEPPNAQGQAGRSRFTVFALYFFTKLEILEKYHSSVFGGRRGIWDKSGGVNVKATRPAQKWRNWPRARIRTQGLTFRTPFVPSDSAFSFSPFASARLAFSLAKCTFKIHIKHPGRAAAEKSLFFRSPKYLPQRAIQASSLKIKNHASSYQIHSTPTHSKIFLRGFSGLPRGAKNFFSFFGFLMRESGVYFSVVARRSPY